MLWSDPRDEPSPEGRRALKMLRRAGPCIAAFAVLAMVLLMI
ncbi:morphogenic membrane protein MmpB [Streptomyces sp. NPDC092296]